MTYQLRLAGTKTVTETDNPIAASRLAKEEVRRTGQCVFVHYGSDCRMYFRDYDGRLAVGTGHAKGRAMDAADAAAVSACDFTEEEAEAWLCGSDAL